MNPWQNSRQAVALTYDGMAAPRVTAKAEGELTDAMLQLAHQHNIPIHRDAQLTQLLTQVKLDREIPIELFVAVAEVLAFTYRLRGMTPPGHPREALVPVSDPPAS